jgi:hypothetical protein
MPLNTQVIRDGESVKVRWGDFHVAAMALAAAFDDKEGLLGDMTKIYADKLHTHPYMPYPISRSVAFWVTSYGALAQTPLNEGQYALKYDHSFIDLVDGEIFELLSGDKLIMYRSF